LARLQVVLVRPQTAANIGAAARIARNTGFDALLLVDPGDWRTVECWRTAWGAHEILEQAVVHTDLRSALATSTYAAGFSGKRGGAVEDVRDVATEVARLGSADVASLVFGRETSDQPSLNLSHAVMVAAYEVFRAARRPLDAPRRATQEEKERMLELLLGGLRAIEALPAENTDGYFREWRALFERADLTPKEVRLLEHMARKMAKGRFREDER